MHENNKKTKFHFYGFTNLVDALASNHSNISNHEHCDRLTWPIIVQKLEKIIFIRSVFQVSSSFYCSSQSYTYLSFDEILTARSDSIRIFWSLKTVKHETHIYDISYYLWYCSYHNNRFFPTGIRCTENLISIHRDVTILD